VTRAPADRSHLSIGEVLSLLQDEFPDVTISKIRFLESQGLLDPERTPSGYRKFYETDIERLRSILKMQRDEYLPLKVIKDRLARQDAGESPDGPAIEAKVTDEDIVEPPT
jgi:DNA-binding transcriptional MerR regulator